MIGAVEYLDVDTDLGDLRDYIQMAYQFQIMGVKKDGTALENFHPYRSVTRAEFATVFSRVLY
nr:MAG TPA: S-layer homology domain [Caudoviricetes sp.]